MELLGLFSVIQIFLIYSTWPDNVLSQSTIADSCNGADDCATKRLLLVREESTRLLNTLEARINQMQKLVDATYTIQKEMQRRQDLQRSKFVPHDCADVLSAGGNKSGVYPIWLADTGRQIDVYCDMDTDGGGWLIFQRRQDGSVEFFRDWSSYKTGFGNVSGEFWLGNDNLNTITSYKTYTLRFDLNDFEGNQRFAVYSSFAIWPESFRYKTRLGSYSYGDAGDCFSYHRNREFSTKDVDNEHGCSNRHKGGWWYEYCVGPNLNGRYLRGAYSSYRDGVFWEEWLGVQYSLKYVDMKLRP